MNVRERSGSAPEAFPAPAALVAKYKTLFEIGRGGMGTIETALERTRPPGAGGPHPPPAAPGGAYERIVALKRMHPADARDRRHVEMFLREARLAQLLVHPNVVHAFDFGEIEGELFLAMEYVEGETLSTLVRAARERSALGLPAAIVASILADACEGLHAAHELRDPATGAPLNVIHRDVSPHNVMVSYEGHVKLLDFGVAKMDSVHPLTRTGEVKGKTSYMSPEQALGEPLDRRSDLFSIGAVLFECLAGRKMWGNGTELETMRKLALEEPPRLAEAAPHAPRAMCDLHARLVAKSRGERPATALDVARELRAMASGVGAEGVAGLMASLFAEESARRKQLLNEALRAAAPAQRVEVLRRSLAGPTALAALAPTQVQLPSSRPPPASVATVPEGAVARAGTTEPPARATWMGIAASIVVGLLIAGGIVAFMRAKGAESGATTNAISTPTPNAPPASTPSANAVPSPIAPLPAPPVPAPPPAASGARKPAAPRPKPSAAPPVDVDPNPL